MIESAERFCQNLIDRGYIAEAPNAEVAEIDTEVAAGIPCSNCSRPMTYIGLHKFVYGYCSYIALAVCRYCNAAEEF